MTQARLLLVVFLAAAVAAYLTMLLWTMPAIRAGAEGLDLPDVLLSGYSPAYVALYTELLTDQARALYLGTHRAVDTLFAMALTGTISVAAFLLARRWSLVLALALGLVPLFYFAFDMLENAQVAAILSHAAPSEAMAEAASRFTVMKAQALRFAVTVVLFVTSARAFEAAFGPKEG